MKMNKTTVDQYYHMHTQKEQSKNNLMSIKLAVKRQITHF